MQNQIKLTSGTYLLEIEATQDFKIEHKLFGKYFFSKGFYYYSGSAQKNLEQRISRHVRISKNVHWHIDFLTTINSNSVINVFVFENSIKQNECKVISDLIEKFRLDTKFLKFGNSDCKVCPTHLLFSNHQINHNQLLDLYQSTVRLIPSSRFISG